MLDTGSSSAHANSVQTEFRSAGNPRRLCYHRKDQGAPLRAPVTPDCPHRPEAQDVALSRPKHGFESRWGRHHVWPQSSE